MTKYLQINGSGDYLLAPSMLHDEILMDFTPKQASGKNQYYYDGRDATHTSTPYLFRNANNTDGFSGINVYVNGVQIASNQVNSIPTNTRILLKIMNPSGAVNYVSTFFDRYNIDNEYLAADIYDIKFYNAGVLVAHYDMSTGTVNDQSVNGNNATLNGGTWLDDGAGATGTPVTYTYDTKQSICANIQSNYDTKQSIYANRLTNFDTQQSIYKSISQSYDTKQAIYKAIQELFDTEQVFTQVSKSVSYTYDMKIQQYKDTKVSIDTKQAYYTDISVDLDTKQVIYKQIHNLYDTLIQIRNKHDETLYGTLTIQRVIEHRLTINKRHSDDLKIERVLNHILRV